MKKSNTPSTATFSWLAYGGLSLSMLVIAAVSATVGQDQLPDRHRQGFEETKETQASELTAADHKSAREKVQRQLDRIESLVRFEVTKALHHRFVSDQKGSTVKKSPAQPMVIATGILEVESGKIYIETPQENGLLALQSISRNHYAAMREFNVDPIETELAEAASPIHKIDSNR